MFHAAKVTVWAELLRNGMEDYGLDVVGSFIWRAERRARDRQEESIGAKLYHGGTVYVHAPFFSYGFAGNQECFWLGAALLFLYFHKVLRAFSRVDVQF